MVTFFTGGWYQFTPALKKTASEDIPQLKILLEEIE